MGESNDVQQLTAEIRRLVEKLGAPKRKDWSERLAVFSSFFSTVVVAILGLYFTQSSQRAQLGVQQAQVRIEEMKALTSIAPLLASPDSAQRAVAQTILDAVNDSREAAGPAGRPASPSTQRASTTRDIGTGPAALSTLDNFIRRARDARESEAMRVAALRQIRDVATAPNASEAVRARALGAASDLAVTPGVPEGVRRAASDVIAGIQSVQPSEIDALIARAPFRRTVREIIVHHSGQAISNFRGASSVLGIAQFQLGSLGWQKVGWHYAIAPDGTVWLGMPLDERATHARGHNEESVSVMLLLNGEVELPTDEQRRVFGMVMRAVRTKTGLSPQSAEAARRHTDLRESPSPCPGRLITQERVNAWIRGA